MTRPRFKTLALVGLAILLIIAALAVGAVRIVDRALPGYQDELAGWLSARVDQPLTLGGLGLSWTWRGPALSLRDVTILDATGEQAVVRLDAIKLYFPLWGLISGDFAPNGVLLVAPRLAVYRRDDGSWGVRGLARGPEKLTWDELARALDPIERLWVREGRVEVAALGAELKLTDVALQATSFGPRHRLVAQAALPPEWGEGLQLDVSAYGRLAQLEALRVNVHGRATGLAGPRLLALAGVGAPALAGGASTLTLRADWRDQRLQQAQASIAVKPWDFRGEGLAPAMAAEIAVAPAQEGYRIEVASLRHDGQPLADASGRFHFARGWRLAGALRDLPATAVLDVAQIAWPDRLAGVAATGVAVRLALAAGATQPPRVTLAFADAGLAYGDYASPALSGHAEITAAGGSLRVEAGAGIFSAGRYLAKPVPVEQVAAQLAWQTGSGWQVTLSELRLVALESALTGGGSLSSNGGPVMADLSFALESEDVVPLLQRIPQGQALPAPKLREWLARAITAGRITRSSLQLRGEVARFPFADGGGEFRVEIEGEGGRLAYADGWPVLERLAGQLEWHNIRLAVQASHAVTLGVELDRATVEVDDVRNAVLEIGAGVEAAAAPAMLRFIPNSPLNEKFGALVKKIEVQGRAGLDLDVLLPLKPELGEPSVHGEIALQGVRLAHRLLPRPLAEIRGVMRFDLDGLYADDLYALFGGMPLRADLAPAGGGALAIDARAEVRLPHHAEALAGLVPQPVIARAHGSAQVQLDLRVVPSGGISDIVVTSRLQGMALEMPAPLGKPAVGAVPLTVTASPERATVVVDYGERLHLSAAFAEAGLRRLIAVFGGAEAAPPEGAGLWAGGRLPEVSVPAWRAFLAAFAQPGDPATGLDFLGANLSLAGLRLDGQRIPALELVARPLPAATGWAVTLAGEGAQGELRWLRREPGQRPLVTGELAHLAILFDPKSTGAQTPPAPPPENGVVDPAELPIVELSVATLRVEGEDLGRLEISAQAIVGGIALQRLTLAGGIMDVTGSGRWTRTAGASTAALEAHLSGGGIGRLLQVFGYAANIRADAAKITTDLTFAPRAQGIEIGALNGHLEFELEDGSLLAVEPGAGRVLGLVNFYALPRRLLFDFQDVVGEGLVFDSISGEFRIESGNAYTDNLRIDTPGAVIYISGRVGLAERVYDQQVTIAPKLSSAATIAGTVFGGPAVGAALFLVQRLLDQPLSEITAVTYQLTGSWEDPQIEKVEGD